MKKSTRKLTLSTAGLLLCSFLVPTAFAATLPEGTVVSGGLTWTRNNSTVSKRGANWQPAKDACDNLTAGGYTDWRLPSKPELLALYANSKAALSSAGWTLANTWSTATTSPNYHYGVTLNNGNSYNYKDSTDVLVSCVR